jgi:hypothetical protein
MNIKTTTSIEIPHIRFSILKKFRINTTNMPTVTIKEYFTERIVINFLLSILFESKIPRYINKANSEKITNKDRNIIVIILNQL